MNRMSADIARTYSTAEAAQLGDKYEQNGTIYTFLKAPIAITAKYGGLFALDDVASTTTTTSDLSAFNVIPANTSQATYDNVNANALNAIPQIDVAAGSFAWFATRGKATMKVYANTSVSMGDQIVPTATAGLGAVLSNTIASTTATPALLATLLGKKDASRVFAMDYYTTTVAANADVVVEIR